MNSLKTCTKCKEEKTASEFNRNGKNKDGLRVQCRACDAKEKFAYYHANKEKVKSARRDYYEKNKETSIATTRLWQSKNKIKLDETRRAYRTKNKEKVALVLREWKKNNPFSDRLHKQNRRDRKRNNGGSLSAGVVDRLFVLQKGKCACCGKSLGKDFNLDHIVPLALGGRNDDQNVQLLTALCNRQKHAKHPVSFMQERGYLL